MSILPVIDYYDEMSALEPTLFCLSELRDEERFNREVSDGLLEIIEPFKKGEGAKAAHDGLTEIGGKIPINPSGGLKARGHPLGATGVAQVIELVWQLRNEAGKRQVNGAETGITCNFG